MVFEESVEQKYLRPGKKFPSIWCPGCGIGIVLGSIVRAVDRLGLDKNDIAMVSGIGCSGRMPVYADFDGLHTTHGRALPFATGLKLARPDLHILVVMGDGDATAIGGNHFIHAARRNIDLTAIVINNSNYGLTGGQYSPTTPIDARTATSTYGHIEQPFDISRLAEAAGAPFVARTTVYHVFELDKLLVQAMQKKGFSVVEVLSNCHMHFGRWNKLGSAVDMLRMFKESTVPVAQAGQEGGAGKVVRGVLVNRDLPEFVEEYGKIVARAQEEVASV